MVKSSRPSALRLRMNSQVNLLASQFSNSVCLGGDGHHALESNEERMLNWASENATQANSSPDLDSAMSVTPVPAEGSLPKYSALGFEVDLTGSQNSDTPFLRLNPRLRSCIARLRREPLPPRLKTTRNEIALKVREDLFKRRRAQRLSSGLVVSRLLHTARQRLLTDLSLMVPGSIEQIKGADPSGDGELDWSLLQSWLEGQPDIKAQMNLTTKALTLIATYKGPSVEARSLQALKLYAVVVCKLESETYKELCSFLFPEDNRFSSEG